MEEVLSAILSPRRLREVLDEALRIGGLTEVPDVPISLRVFIEGPLFSALSRHLGIGDALDIGAQVRAALALALRDDPASIPPVAHASEVRERGAASQVPEGTRVLAVTKASVVVFLLQDVLGDGVEVIPVGTERVLEDRLRRLGATAPLIVVDRRHPAVDVDACRLLVGHASKETTVIWWAADGAEQLEVEEQLSHGPRVIPTHRDMELADLGELCRYVIDLM